MSNNFSVIGGDARNFELAKLLAEDGNQVFIFGLDKFNFKDLDFKNIELCNSLEDAISQGDIVIGPTPFTRDGGNLNSPFSSTNIEIDDFASWLDNKLLLAGSIPESFYKVTQNINVLITDFMKIEEIAVLNIIATAEGAISKIIENTDFNLQGSNVLIIGFGRIGKVLSKKLEVLGAKVTCSARKTTDLAWIETYGYNKVNTYNLQNLSEYNVIINTVPHIIFNKELLEQVNKDAVLIELASKPGGFNLNVVKDMGLKYIPALGLPGKVAPKSSAKFLMQFIYKAVNK